MHRLAWRPGFTLVETLVALCLFQIGMLALVASAGVAACDLAEAVARRRAHAIASARAETLRAGACRAARTGVTMLSGGMMERWRIEVAGDSRSITDSIDVTLPRGRRVSVAARAWTVCAS